MSLFFFFNDTATTWIYTYGHTLSLHDALPICGRKGKADEGWSGSQRACPVRAVRAGEGAAHADRSCTAARHAEIERLQPHPNATGPRLHLRNPQARRVLSVAPPARAGQPHRRTSEQRRVGKESARTGIMGWWAVT